VRRLLALPLLAGFALALSSCGNTIQDQPISTQSLEQLVAVDAYPIYWLGGTFHDLAVSSVARDPSEAFTIQYGDCTVGGQGTCVTPLEIVTSPNNSFAPGAGAIERAIHIRGVRAWTAEEGRALMIPTGSVVVDIYAETAQIAAAAVRTMVSINLGGDPGGRLPAASPDSGFGGTPVKAQRPSMVRLLAPAAGGV
jgi:hypothetical protein